MLLAIDIGNSNISVGLFDKARELRFLASLDTDSRKTADQISIDLMNLFTLYGCDIHDVSGAIFASVVPPINFMMEKALTRLLGKPPMMVGAGIKTGMNIIMDNPKTVGSDMIVDAVAAIREYPGPIIIIDMGTATTMSVVDKNGNYIGGIIYPGLRVSLDSLSSKTAQLPSISLDIPKRVIGKNTIDCMRSGIMYGNAGMIDGILEHMEEELGEPATIIATGGLSRFVVPLCKHKIIYDDALLLKGLMIIYEKNKA